MVQILAMSLFATGVAGWLLHHAGLNSFVVSWVLSVGVGWLVFVRILHWRAGAEFRALKFTRSVSSYVVAERAVLSREASEVDAPLSRVTEVFASGSADNTEGGIECFQLSAVILSFGMSFLWQLINSGPELIPSVIVDSHMRWENGGVESGGHFVSLGNSCSNPVSRDVLATTGFYFLGFAIVAFIIGSVAAAVLKPGNW